LAWLGKQALEWFGYTVFSTTNSVDALDAFRAAPDEFDLVVTDQTMPQMTGMELAAELRQIRPSIPVILCTGYSELVTEQNLRAADIQEVMMKPLAMHEVGRIIRSVLDRQGRKQMAEPNIKQILVVDDEASFRTVTQQFLLKMGYTSEVAASAPEALEILKKRHFDLVLSDIRMKEKKSILIWISS